MSLKNSKNTGTLLVLSLFIFLFVSGCSDDKSVGLNENTKTTISEKPNLGRIKLLERAYSQEEQYVIRVCIDFHMKKHSSYASLGTIQIVEHNNDADMYLSLRAIESEDRNFGVTFAILDREKKLESHGVYIFNNSGRDASTNLNWLCGELAKMIIDAKTNN